MTKLSATRFGWFYGDEGLPDWVMAVFAFGTYLTTAILIWWERKRLGLNPSAARTSFSATFFFLLPSALIQMLNAAVWEEPLFRGFLWGYLRKASWKDLWILLFQAALFALGHVYYLRTEPMLTWAARMLIPSLTLGLVVWGARSIAASMVAHGFINATGDMMMHSRSAAEAMQTATSALIVIAVVFVVSLLLVRFRETGRMATEGG